MTNIGGGAFSACSLLTSITIPNGVMSIGVQTFYRCSSLTSINLPDSLTSIGYDAFKEYIDTGLGAQTVGEQKAVATVWAELMTFIMRQFIQRHPTGRHSWFLPFLAEQT